MENVVLTAQNIRKTYVQRDVLTDACLSVRCGEAVALVGENGCGKSTLLRILCGVTHPTGGMVQRASGLRSAFIPDHFEKTNMSAMRFLEYMRRLEGATPEATARYCELFAMDSHLNTPLRYLSKGMLQKIAVIQALMSERDILFMDEPLSGQDAESQLHFADEIRRRRQDGMAVVMACHDPFLIETLADCVLEIKDGVLIDGTDYLVRGCHPRCALLVIPNSPADDLFALLARELPEVQPGISMCGQLIRIEADRANGPALMELLLRHGIRIVRYEEAI